MIATNLFPLVKADTAAVYLGMRVAKVYDLATGGSRNEPGLLWVFNLANDLERGRRDLRFLRAELVARGKGQDAQFQKMNLEQVLATFLPLRRERFSSGEVDRLLNVRHNTRLYYQDLPGVRSLPGYVYTRQSLVDFLTKRWLGTPIRAAIKEAA